ncbi:MFS transporter [Ruminococcaceae bacterium OttesenSCG-928-D13]|nr:MFS transporter [Ruminococcaceae bacterium OttesenSCG-928-D13]
MMEKKKFHYAWVILIGCCLLSFIQMGLITNTNSLFIPFILQDVGLSMTNYTAIIMVQTLLLAVGMAIAGRLFATGKIKQILIVAGLIEGGAIFLRSQATNMTMWVIAAVMYAIGSAFLGGALTYILLANWFQEKMGLATGIMAASTGFGGVVWNPIVGILINNFGWRTAMMINAFIIFGVALLLGLFVMRFAPGKNERPYGAKKDANAKDGKEASAQTLPGPSYKAVSKTLPFVLVVAVSAFMALSLAMQQMISPQLTENGFSVTQISFVMSALMFGTAVSQLLTGVLMDKFDHRIVITILAILGGAGWVGVALGTSYTMIIVASVLIGCAASIMQVALAVVRRKVCGVRSYSQVSSISGAFSAILPAIGMVMAGIFFDANRSYTMPFLITVGLIAVSVLMIYVAYNGAYDKPGTKMNMAYLAEQKAEAEKAAESKGAEAMA